VSLQDPQPHVAQEVAEIVEKFYTPEVILSTAYRSKLQSEEYSGFVKGISSVVSMLRYWSLAEGDK
jgi:hypothetical protein